MKRHSILSTIFPRLAFSRKSLGEIQTEGPEGNTFSLKPWLGEFLGEENSNPIIYVSDFLPRMKFSVGIDGQTATGFTEFRSHLSYCEEDETKKIFETADNSAIAHITVKPRTSEGETKIWEKIEIPHEEDLGKVLVYFWDLLDDENVVRVDFQVNIYVKNVRLLESEIREKHPDKNWTTEKLNLAVAALRKEYVASELTTVYRRLISIYLVLLAGGAQNSKRKCGTEIPSILYDFPDLEIVHKSQTAIGGLHSSLEDAWRLLCSFHSVEVASKKVNRNIERENNYVLSLQDFIDGMTWKGVRDNVSGLSAPTLLKSAPRSLSSAEQLIEELFLSKAIDRKIGLRKTLEYFIFEELPCMPRSCSF